MYYGYNTVNVYGSGIQSYYTFTSTKEPRTAPTVLLLFLMCFWRAAFILFSPLAFAPHLAMPTQAQCSGCTLEMLREPCAVFGMELRSAIYKAAPYPLHYLWLLGTILIPLLERREPQFREVQ